MKKSGHSTIFHISSMFFIAIIFILGLIIFLFYSLIMVKNLDGSFKRSNYPKTFCEEFSEHIIFVDDMVKINESGIELLKTNNVGIQILDKDGKEILSFQKPEVSKEYYSMAELLEVYEGKNLSNNKITSYVSDITHNENEYIYIMYFPMNITKVTMYFNGDNFSSGKQIIMYSIGSLLLVVIILATVYVFWITRIMKLLIASIKDISIRSYIKVNNKGIFGDVYESLNNLNDEITKSDDLRKDTDKMRKEWIANITHDLKTPLSPIRGYAEILNEKDVQSNEQVKKYVKIMLKNISNMESLIDQMKLTYQLDSGMVPATYKKQNLVSFFRELVIDILNMPKYENNVINFKSNNETIMYYFDEKLLTRAFQNLIINAFVHGGENIEVSLKINLCDSACKIIISDNGKGMESEEVQKLFNRYYRGTNTEHKVEGTGLGLHISKSIIEMHGGTIKVNSKVNVGTSFEINLPIKVN